MYGRTFDDRELNFEPSGGLLHDALVMQDRETDSYWSIITGDALAGEFRGSPLRELPIGVKMPFGQWVERHPDTLVLSVDGVEHDETDPYENYFSSEEGFRGHVASDARLATKTPVYGVRIAGESLAVVLDQVEGGATFDIGDRQLFLYRSIDAALFESTRAFSAGIGHIVRAGERWHHVPSGAVFDTVAGRFVSNSGSGPEPLDGFDTFWFHWSETHPGTRVLR